MKAKAILDHTAVIMTILMAAQATFAQPVLVELQENPAGHWRLLRDGVPYAIKGAGGSGPKDLLAASGANTFRTWAVGPDLGDKLDEAHALGLTVVVGHWLGHPRHGFDYADTAKVAEQFERVRRDVLLYKDHPALLFWGVGNEMEGFADGDDPNVWTHVQDIAAMIHELDPNHPTMTVTAEIGGARVPMIHAMCPDIDIMGINSYGGLPSLAERYRAQGGMKPIVITEFGPPGTWECAYTDYGAPLELTSTEKAVVYRDAFTRGCLEAGGLCLGGFAFTWGSKMEATSTWYGMFLPDGDKLGAVDAMTEVWCSHPAADLCPEIRSFGIEGPDVVARGDTVRVALDVVDPEGADLDVRWTIRGEASSYLLGGDYQATPLELDGAIVESSITGAVLVMPGGGVYRLYMTAHDGTGGAATANVPLKVEGEPGGARAKMPVTVYADGAPPLWYPSGWMGNNTMLTMDLECPDDPHTGDTCLRFTYDDYGMWVGVAWQHPANDWGEKPGGYNLTGAEKLTFWARGAEGGEKLDFAVGLLGSDKEYHDTVKAERKGVKLKKEWKRYEIKLKGADLSRVKTPFVWTLAGRGRPVTFYLDDIRFE